MWCRVIVEDPVEDPELRREHCEGHPTLGDRPGDSR